MDVFFPTREVIDPLRDGIAFPAEVDGVTVKCLVSREALEDHFGADLHLDMGSAFKQNRSTIESIAERFIRTDRYEADKEIIVRTADIR